MLRGLDLGVNDYLVRPDRPQRAAWPACARRCAASAMPTGCARPCMRPSSWRIVDPLTGLHNRRYLDSHFGPLLDEALNRGRPLSVMVLDIDRFKQINDTHGHDAGDDVLQGVRPARSARSVRSVDLVVPARRRGIRRGDARHADRDRAARGRAHPAQGAGRAVPHPRGRMAIPVTVSIGVSAVEDLDGNGRRPAQARRRGALCRQERRAATA